MADGRKLRLGIVGLGMAGGLMVPYVAAHPRFMLAGAAEPDERLQARLRQDHPVPVVADVAGLVRRDDIDAVYIATPHQFHREHLLLAAAHGKHAIVEKPMALSLADCDAMIAAADRAQVVLIVGHTHGFDPTVARIRELARDEDFGSPVMLVMANYTDFLYRPRRPEELDTARGGGILFNQIPHQVDIARLLADAPVRSVRASAWRLDAARPTEGACMAMLGFANGAAASLAYSGYDRFDSDELHGWIGSTGRPRTPRHGASRRALAELSGATEAKEAAGAAGARRAAETKGAASAPGERERELRTLRYGYGGGAFPTTGSPTHPPHFGSLIASYQRADVRTTPTGLAVYDEGGVRTIDVDPRADGRRRVLDELAAAVLDGAPPVHDGRFGRGTVATALAIRQSAQQQREILLD